MGFVTGICQIWAPIPCGSVISHVANNWIFQFYQYGEETSPYLTNPNDKPLLKISLRGTPYQFSNAEIEPCDWPKRRHMVNFRASHWSRALLVFFPTHLGVEGSVIYGWDLSNLGDSPYMTNLGDKTQDSRRGKSRSLSGQGPIFDKSH